MRKLRALTVRGAAADAIARSQPTAPQQARLAAALKNFAASEITTVIESFKAGGDETLGDALIRSLTAAPAAASLNAYRVKNLFAAFNTAVQHRAQPLLDRLAAADKEQMARAERVLPMITTASTERGHAVFQSSKTACLVCHIAVLTGGNIGPSLSALGQRRSERDILESILFPSASFVQSYESWTATLKDGGIFSGTLLADQPDEIELGLGAAKQRIPRASIASLVKGNVSIMPAGLDRSMNDQELADLVAYLKSLK